MVLSKLWDVPVDECPPGLCMNFAVARALDLIVVHDVWANTWFVATDNDIAEEGREHNCELMYNEPWGAVRYYLEMPNYSGNMKEAWELVRHIRAQDGARVKYALWLTDALEMRTGKQVLFDSLTTALWLDIEPVDICRAFLKYKGITQVEVWDD